MAQEENITRAAEAAGRRRHLQLQRRPASGHHEAGNKEIRENLKLRHVRYKEQWGKVRELEKAGKALVLRPHKDLGVTRYTTDRELLAPWFQLGYDETKERMDEIRAFIEMD